MPASTRSGSTRTGRDKSRLLAAGTTDHYVDTDLYDFEYSDRDEDVQWYRDLAQGLGTNLRVVELGAGTGRITIPLAQQGHQVTAVDAMPTMLQALIRRLTDTGLTPLVTAIEGDIRKLDLPEQSFDLVIAPFNVLMHLYTYDDLLRCFREAARVLRPGGTFAFDVQMPDLPWLGWDPDERHAVTRFTHPRTGEKLLYSTNHTYDSATQVCHIRIYYDEAPPRGRRFVPPARPKRLVHLAHRQIFPEELRLLVASAGLELVRPLMGDFLDRDLFEGAQSQVALCRRAAARP